MSNTRVMVSGCYDLLHSGHVAFLQEAATHGKVTVCLGADKTVLGLKGRPPVNNQDERQYMLSSLSCVDEARVSRGSGHLDFLPELDEIKPDIFFVNTDGHSDAKRDAVLSRGIEYKISERKPHENLTPRSTTSLRTREVVPYRLDLAGGWLDQPFVSELYPGSVINISLEPESEYERRSGMASSTRNTAMSIWGPRLPVEHREKLAKLLFAFENKPGTVNIAGSQDPIGIVYPGLNKIDYNNDYWPHNITSTLEPDVMSFLEDRLYLKFVEARPGEFEVLDEQHLSKEHAKALADAAERFWDATLAMDAAAAGAAMTQSFDAQVAMFPLMRSPAVNEMIDRYRDQALGYKISGAGGGGYVVFFSDTPIPDAIRPKIRRED